MGPCFRRDDGGGSSGPHPANRDGRRAAISSHGRFKLRYNASCNIDTGPSPPLTRARTTIKEDAHAVQGFAESAWQDCSAEEWQARVDLAAAHRLAFMQGFSEGIFNHLTLVVPGRSRPLLSDPVRDALVGGRRPRPSWRSASTTARQSAALARWNAPATASTHRSTRRGRRAKAVFHTHMPYASALTRLEDPRIREIGQTEVGMMGEIAYDDAVYRPGARPAPKAIASPR